MKKIAVLGFVLTWILLTGVLIADVCCKAIEMLYKTDSIAYTDYRSA